MTAEFGRFVSESELRQQTGLSKRELDVWRSQRTYDRALRNFFCLQEHQHEYQPGEWVAIHKQQPIAHAATPSELRACLRQKGIDLSKVYMGQAMAEEQRERFLTGVELPFTDASTTHS